MNSQHLFRPEKAFIDQSASSLERKPNSKNTNKFKKIDSNSGTVKSSMKNNESKNDD